MNFPLKIIQCELLKLGMVIAMIECVARFRFLIIKYKLRARR